MVIIHNFQVLCVSFLGFNEMNVPGFFSPHYPCSAWQGVQIMFFCWLVAVRGCGEWLDVGHQSAHTNGHSMFIYGIRNHASCVCRQLGGCYTCPLVPWPFAGSWHVSLANSDCACDRVAHPWVEACSCGWLQRMWSSLFPSQSALLLLGWPGISM